MNKFITFEGGEGAGKSSVIASLSKYLTENGHNIISTREPGGIKIAESIRNVILDINHGEMDSRTEALLYAAARRQHLVERIIPALNEDKVVLCDRFLDSSLAYQGIARGLGLNAIYNINNFAIDECMPSLTIYYDIKPEIGLERISKSKTREVNRLDKENLDFHYKVRDGYLKLTELYPDRIVTVNADSSLEQVIKNTIEIVCQHLKHCDGRYTI